MKNLIQQLTLTPGPDLKVGGGSFSPIPARQRSTVTKEIAEDLVLDCVRDGLPAAVVNPAYFVGPFDCRPSPFRLWFPLAIISRVRLVPRGGFNVVGAADVPSAHLWAPENGTVEERYPYLPCQIHISC